MMNRSFRRRGGRPGPALRPVLVVAVLVAAVAMMPVSLRGEETRRPALAVLPLEAKGGLEAEVAEALDDYLSGQVFQTGAFEMVNRDKIQEVVREFRLQESDLCDTTKCYAELGGAMGAEKLLVGSVSRLGDRYITALKLIDITLIQEEYVDSDTCACPVGELTGSLDVLVRKMTDRMGLGSGGADASPAGARGEALPAGAAPGDMVLVPAGEFWMGAAKSDAKAQDDEKPGRRVYLDAFLIDRTEVTAAAYREFLDAVENHGHRWCAGGEPADHDHVPGGWDDARWTAPDQPAVGVDWYDAYAFCAWKGGRLPREAEWEKAARGTDGRIYPWGDAYDGRLANASKAVGKTTPVGSYPGGASPYGALDMAGNVWEWVHDHYDVSYYAAAPASNPMGPGGGSSRVLRGGSWSYDPDYLRASNRNHDRPTDRHDNVGFRCAQDPE